jgi:hypothetical protein
MLKPLFSGSSVNEDRLIAIFQKKMLMLLQAAGEQFVKIAREEGSYKDRTGNLRSSIGYVIVSDGTILEYAFQKASEGSEGDKGVDAGYELAKKISTSYTTGMVLIGVAGMNYALAVEAIKGLDVITGASIQTEQWLKKALKAISNKK